MSHVITLTDGKIAVQPKNEPWLRGMVVDLPIEQQVLTSVFAHKLFSLLTVPSIMSVLQPYLKIEPHILRLYTDDVHVVVKKVVERHCHTCQLATHHYERQFCAKNHHCVCSNCVKRQESICACKSLMRQLDHAVCQWVCPLCNQFQSSDGTFNWLRCITCWKYICQCCRKELDTSENNDVHACPPFNVSTVRMTQRQCMRFANFKKYSWVLYRETAGGILRCGRRISLYEFNEFIEPSVRSACFLVKTLHITPSTVPYACFLEANTFIEIETVLCLKSCLPFRPMELGYLISELRRVNMAVPFSHQDVEQHFRKWLDVSCEICFEELKTMKHASCSSKVKHFFCVDCLQRNVRTKRMHLARQCPAPKCEGTIDVSKLNLSKATEVIMSLGDPSLFRKCAHCPETLCGTDDDMKATEFQCPVCEEYTCNRCLQPAHRQAPCKFQEEFMREIANAGIRFVICPQCKNNFERTDESCNKLVCAHCKPLTLFCACCQKAFPTENQIYTHFCRNFADSAPCSKLSCAHCFLWPTFNVAKNANAEFLKQYPQFRA